MIFLWVSACGLLRNLSKAGADPRLDSDQKGWKLLALCSKAVRRVAPEDFGPRTELRTPSSLRLRTPRAEANARLMRLGLPRQQSPVRGRRLSPGGEPRRTAPRRCLAR